MRSSSSSKPTTLITNIITPTLTHSLPLYLGINTILNQSNSSSSSKSSGISRKPTSALSKIGKHVPPPISPIIAFKSTAKTTASPNIKETVSAPSKLTESTTLVTSSSTCAWRIPKVSEAPVNQSTNYPQRKVPELTPVPTAVKEPEKPKGFLERFEEFPNLLKQQQQQQTISFASVNEAPQRPPQKLLGGDFNFLEDDDWLDGDNIDYSQNLFEDDDHFLPSYILEEPVVVAVKDSEVASTNGNDSGLCHVKAKSLLAERHHSSNKKDIWKRTDDQPKMKIKILKRPEQPAKEETVETVERVERVERESVPVSKEEPTKITTKSTSELTKKFTTSLKLKETKTVEEPKQQEHEQTKKPLKIVYSSASKTLQKM